MKGNPYLESDIAIIGAGLAGMLASMWLTKTDTPHIIVDSKSFPREKACGDIITSKAIRRLNEISPEIIPNMVAEGFLQPVKGTLVYPTNNKSICLNFKWLDNAEGIHSCYSVKRHFFDSFLMNRIKKSSVAQTITGRHINDIHREKGYFLLYAKDGSTIKTKLIIGAAGSNSQLPAPFPPFKKEAQHVAIGIRAYFKGVDCKDSYGELILDKNLLPGGVYITSLTDGICNVNLVMRKDVMTKKKINLKKIFPRLIQENPLLEQKFRNATQLSEFKGSSLFLGTEKRKISGEGFMFAGDAAGLIDLISANGIPQAMLSGKLAAFQALECIKHNDFSAEFLRSYDQVLYKNIKGDLSIGKLFNPVLSYPLVQNTALAALNFIATGSEKNSSLTDLFYSKNPVADIFNPMFYYKLMRENQSIAKK